MFILLRCLGEETPCYFLLQWDFCT